MMSTQQNPEAPGDKVSAKKIGWAKKLFRLTERTFAIIGILFIIYHTCFNVSAITSDSMAPTLIGENSDSPDIVLAERISYWFRKPRRWEIVKYHTPDILNIQVMKRIAALPGETIAIEDYWLQIDDRPIERPESLHFLKYYPFGYLHKGRSQQCTNGYFVLGDDSKDSSDSRFDGEIPLSKLEGRAWLILWPPSRFGLLTP
jgi:signal peptidase I